MTGNFHPNEPDDRDDSSDDHWLSTLLSALAALDSDDTTGRRTTGSRHTDRSVIDYDISMRSIDDLEEAGRDADTSSGRRTPHSGSPAGSGTETSDSGRPRTRRTTTSDHRVTKREYDDELLVTADINGIEPDDVTVGFDESVLVIGVSGQELDRVEVPWPDGQRTSNATVKNGVLTVHVEPIADESDGDAESSAEGDDE
ncbi:Hsp20/alpha crystallin family protein [Natronolimnobius sp. AArcel1]|uniref:Hsp20/alpha crystallin family protein n=1 Tax=Natronolimnobius sp. AArcel1 TaxID=1679093 RepID=UPI0013E9B358|nr:Hsp20/alpha crystallin family protein [Natronolimnobius sp. AArcel1]NGM69019.1 Hsp20/alpha crystallin family protein [Natronolimnobius sp. AArcel1]